MNVLAVKDDLFPFGSPVTTADDDDPDHNFPDADWLEDACELLESIDQSEENIAPDSEWLEEARKSFLDND